MGYIHIKCINITKIGTPLVDVFQETEAGLFAQGQLAHFFKNLTHTNLTNPNLN